MRQRFTPATRRTPFSTRTATEYGRTLLRSYSPLAGWYAARSTYDDDADDARQGGQSASGRLVEFAGTGVVVDEVGDALVPVGVGEIGDGVLHHLLLDVLEVGG